MIVAMEETGAMVAGAMEAGAMEAVKRGATVVVVVVVVVTRVVVTRVVDTLAEAVAVDTGITGELRTIDHLAVVEYQG